MSNLLTLVIIVLCVVALLVFIVLIVYLVRFLKELSIVKKRMQYLQKRQRETEEIITMMKQKIVEVETTPLFGQTSKRVLQYKNAATSIVGFRKQQKIKKLEKQIKKSKKARKVQRKVRKQYGK